jgi:D-alanine-D-alanine ligase
MQPPYVVKPDTEDNSLGISVITCAAEAIRAVAGAFEYDDTVFAEAFVPGREIRAAVVETDDGPIVPAFIEYPVSEARPIREMEDKLQPDGSNGALRQSTRPEAQPVCPASVTPSLAYALQDAAMAGHRAIGARHYSLFDFRVHRDTGEPVMLEAGLFWSFSELSAISKMLTGAGLDPRAITEQVWRRAAA